MNNAFKEEVCSDIKVIDGFLSDDEVAQLYLALNGPVWRFGWKSKKVLMPSSQHFTYLSQVKNEN